MIAVIIAGGSGTRLWPLSTPTYPKHLLRINGNKRSLLQSTYDRVKDISSAVYVVSEISHAQHVRNQLTNLPETAFIIEPARRGTANCIVLALNYIAKYHQKNEPIAFIAADHYVRDIEGFTRSFKIAVTASKVYNKIVLIGVEPNYPATGFGYIQKGEILDEESIIYNVKAFKEKPDYKTAQKYLKSGNYLWNCSYFVATLETFLETMREYAPLLFGNYQTLHKNKSDNTKTYLGFEDISIDYALIEKVKSLLVIPAAFDWMDLGSFNDLHKAVEVNESGNHIEGTITEVEDVENSFIHNNGNRPLVVVGLDNVVIISNEHGLLVARKDLSQKVGEISKRIIKKNDTS